MGKGEEHGACRAARGGAVRAVAAYVRVSTRSQDAAYQRQAIERAAAARGEPIGVWFADVASGASMARPELQRLLAAIRAGEVRRVWVWRLDRLTRSGIVDTLGVVEELRRHACECASVADGFALDGPAADVVLAVLAWAAQLEREKIGENQAAARERMEAQGRAWGRPRTLDHTVVMGQIREMRAAGVRPSEIARALNVSRTHIARLLRRSEQQAAAENEPL